LTESGAAPAALEDVVLPLREALKNARVEAVIERGGRQRGQADAALDLAARQALLDQLPQLRLERPELVGQPEVQFEEALVDAAQVDADAGMVEVEAAGGKPGHAGCHGRRVWVAG